ncbi:MAG TPA: hypothetical protein VGX03_31660 [Candidatus Binatia bacterium]|nr:hypothetical protein [Candidatus Binatia bacterium]
MSTILDALRKVEENHRTRSADARARLLSSPTRPRTYSFRQRRTLWLIGTGLALSGFTAGIGLMLWGPHSPAPEGSQIAGATGGDVPPDKEVNPLEPPAQSSSRPSGQAPTQSPARPLSRATAEVPSTPASTAPRLQQLTREERRAARREALRARRAAALGTPPPESRDLAAATRATQPRPLPQPRESTQPVASVPRTAAPGTTSSPSESTAAPVPPNTSLSFLQWSPEPDRRLAFIKVEGGPLTLAHEGDTVAGYTVVEIRRDAVELSAKGHSFTLQVGP